MSNLRELLSIVCLLFLASLPYFPEARAQTSPPALQLPLSTQGTQIVDAQGRQVVLRGVNASGMEWGAGTRWGSACNDPQWGRRYGCYALPAEPMYDNLARWGFNLVRLPVSWANLEPRPGEYNDAYLRDLDAIVDALAARNLPVIFSMHQWAWSAVFSGPKPETGEAVHGNGWPVWLYDETWLRINPVTGLARTVPLTYGDEGQAAASREFFANRRMVGGEPIQTKLADLWRILALRYRDRPNVIGADLMNEPYGNAPGQLESFYRDMARTVHGVAPNWLLVFERSLSSGSVDGAAILASGDLPRDKAVYSYHVYAGRFDDGGPKPGARTRLADALHAAAAWQVPFWLGEFHCIMRAGAVDPQQTQALLAYMNKDGVGGNGVADFHWTYWAYQRDAQPLGGPVGNGPVNWNIVNALRAGLSPPRLLGYGKVVVEFFEPELNHYFYTANAAEQAMVDSGAVGHWLRTGLDFNTGGDTAVCRFYGNPAAGGPNGHFYTVSQAECAQVKLDPGWHFESNDFIAAPLAAAGCAEGLQPVYRAYNGRYAQHDSNHRLSTDWTSYRATVAEGWIAEGPVMCVPL